LNRCISTHIFILFVFDYYVVALVLACISLIPSRNIYSTFFGNQLPVYDHVYFCSLICVGVINNIDQFGYAYLWKKNIYVFANLRVLY
jgi:hypothetical protein